MLKELAIKSAKNKIKKVFEETAEKNKLSITDVRFAITWDGVEEIKIIPYYNKKSHGTIGIEDLFSD